MSNRAPAVLLWLFIINLGIAVGAGLYEHRVVIPDWISGDGSNAHWNADVARRDDTGLRFWAYVTTGPLTLLTLANFIVAWRAPGPERRWWLGAAVVVLADRLLTFLYFIPAMVALMKATDSPESVLVATQWTRLNYVRHALLFVGWMAALKAFSLFYRGTARQ